MTEPRTGTAGPAALCPACRADRHPWGPPTVVVVTAYGRGIGLRRTGCACVDCGPLCDAGYVRVIPDADPTLASATETTGIMPTTVTPPLDRRIPRATAGPVHMRPGEDPAPGPDAEVLKRVRDALRTWDSGEPGES